MASERDHWVDVEFDEEEDERQADAVVEDDDDDVELHGQFFNQPSN